MFPAFFNCESGNVIFKKISRFEDLKRADLPDVPYSIVVSTDHFAMGNDVRWQLANLLVETNAMHVAAHGNQGTLLDDDVDMVQVESNVLNGVKLPHVMTTWHDDETLEEVVEFMGFVKPFEEWNVESWPTIVLKIGG